MCKVRTQAKRPTPTLLLTQGSVPIHAVGVVEEGNDAGRGGRGRYIMGSRGTGIFEERKTKVVGLREGMKSWRGGQSMTGGKWT